MRHRTKTLIEGKYYKLTKRIYPKTKKSDYVIHVSGAYQLKPADQEDVRNHFDPGRNRGSAKGFTWKYKSRAEAEHLISIAILKWSGT